MLSFDARTGGLYRWLVEEDLLEWEGFSGGGRGRWEEGKVNGGDEQSCQW